LVRGIDGLNFWLVVGNGVLILGDCLNLVELVQQASWNACLNPQEIKPPKTSGAFEVNSGKNEHKRICWNTGNHGRCGSTLSKLRRFRVQQSDNSFFNMEYSSIQSHPYFKMAFNDLFLEFRFFFPCIPKNVGDFGGISHTVSALPQSSGNQTQNLGYNSPFFSCANRQSKIILLCAASFQPDVQPTLFPCIETELLAVSNV
jgi:hypothetical protein